MSTGKRALKPMSTEEFVRKTFEEGKHRKNRDYTPRTFQPDGTMNTEDWLREVVFGVERATEPIRKAVVVPVSAPQQVDVPTPFGVGTVLFPGREVLPRSGVEGAGSSAASAAGEPDTEASRREAAKVASRVLSHVAGVGPALGHGATKGVNETVDLIYDLGEKLRGHLPEAVDYSLNWDFREGGKGVSLDKGAPVAVPNLPQMFPEPAPGFDKAVSGAGQFAVGYLIGNKALKTVKAGTRGLQMAKSLGTGAIADFVAFDGKEAGISDVIQQYPALAGPVTEYLADRSNGGEIEGRLKNALEGLGLGAASEAFMHGLRLTKAGRAATRGELDRQAQLMGEQSQTRRASREMKLPPPSMDYTDLRSPDAMHYAGRELRGVAPTEADRLFVGGGNKRGYYTKWDVQNIQLKLQQERNIAATSVETAPGQWKLREEAVPPPATTRQLRSVAEDLHKAALRGEKPSYAVGVIGPDEAARVRAATGYNLLLHRRTLNAEDVMHGMDRHNRQAAAIGETPITYADMGRYNEIVGSPDLVSRGARPNSIIYEKRYPDGTVYVAEQILRGNNIEFRSMYKNKVAERMRPTLLPAVPLRGLRGASEEE